jgi:hypothetical protein
LIKCLCPVGVHLRTIPSCVPCECFRKKKPTTSTPLEFAMVTHINDKVSPIGAPVAVGAVAFSSQKPATMVRGNRRTRVGRIPPGATVLRRSDS